MGIKAIAIYRDNCKVAQPLSGKKKLSRKEEQPVAAVAAAPAPVAGPPSVVNDRIVVKGAMRRQLPRRRQSHTYKFSIADLKGFFTVGGIDDGSPGEFVYRCFQTGFDAFRPYGFLSLSLSAMACSMAYRSRVYVKTLMSSSFAPAGITDDTDIRTASYHHRLHHAQACA
jgi:ribonucleoside-diphosphate reductase alpha chain